MLAGADVPSDSEFHALLDIDRPAPPVLVHRLDFTGECPCCGAVAFQRYDAEQIVCDDADQIGAALLYTCGACQSTTTRGFIVRTDLTDDDLLKVLDLRDPVARMHKQSVLAQAFGEAS